MEKKINNIFIVILSTFFGMWLTSALVYYIGTLGVFQSELSSKDTSGYILQYICIGLTLAGVPLALKLFTLNTTKNLKRMNFDEALNSYMAWSIVRIYILELISILGFISYFLIDDISCAVCSLIALTTSLMCFPSKDKIKYYLENLNKDQD